MPNQLNVFFECYAHGQFLQNDFLLKGIVNLDKNLLFITNEDLLKIKENVLTHLNENLIHIISISYQSEIDFETINNLEKDIEVLKSKDSFFFFTEILEKSNVHFKQIVQDELGNISIYFDSLNDICKLNTITIL